MGIKVCGHRVLVKPDAIENVSSGGIVIVQDERRESRAVQRGTVVAIGPTAWHAYDKTSPDWEPWAQIGDRVDYARHAGRYTNDPENPEEELVLLNDEDIQTVVWGETK